MRKRRCDKKLPRCLECTKASVSLPSYVAGELGSGQEHEYIGRIFFKTIHNWFPMVSRKRFYEELRTSSKGPGVTADLGFLLLAMKLMTWHPSSSEDDFFVEEKTARTAKYRAAKQFGFELEAAGLFSLRILQGILLVALYEIGHAIYPAAFMSIAACVRYAHALGIQPGGLQRLKLPLSWVEEEERKRVWWSAFLLDRFVSLSCPGSPAAIDEPDPDDHLPTDDLVWDEGAKSVPCSPLLHSPVSMEFGRFALLIQAFVLMSKVLRLASSSRDIPIHLLKDEVQQLERTVKALLYFGRIECKWRNGLPSCELHSVSHLSLIAIYTSSTVPVEMPNNFIESLADVLDAFNYEQIVADAHHGQDEISPFLIQLLYQTSVILLGKERPRNGDWGETRVEKLKNALLWLDKRWKLAGRSYISACRLSKYEYAASVQPPSTALSRLKLTYASIVAPSAAMSNRGESVILPSNAVFLVHKVGGAKAGRAAQWETRTKTMRAAPDPTPRIAVANGGNSGGKAKRDAAEGTSWEFVTYTPRKGQQLPSRPKEIKRKRRVENSSPKDRSIVTVKQEPTLSRSPTPMLPDLPVALVGHALLYINFSTGAYTLPCLLFNPAKRDWFPQMMEDETWRCIILSLSASTLASMTGSSSNYVDSHSLLDEALRQLKGRVASDALPSDKTLGAISCLSMWSNELGNYDKAWVHARGLAELVKLRGGFSKIDNRMRSKVYRGVFDIAVDVDRPPLLDDGLRDSPSRELIPEDSLDLDESELAPPECRIPPRLSSIFHDIVQLNTTLDDAITRNIKLDTDYLYETVFGLYNRLLTCKSDRMSDCDNSLRLCLILYIKSLSSSQRLNLTSMNLVRQLQLSIEDCLSSSTPLTRWKLFIGCMAASEGSAEQQWFLQQLATAATENGMVGEEGWKAFQSELSSILWTKPINEAVGYKIWLQVTVAQST
ncbi:hypothetical protein TARUN_3581 [Trichoderma arundinaceum]|uniref:Xylanolytic transcriptional activator regulatory domain-containing protein n=1 Tax=Trichoderma arundinaceum TaxID=490622 RepID=A0A395NRP8_TRIAR|nr:hypothetical protein TARUN_3581 [Trichoderma arundinaceum]